eukprot:jgi/Chrzof1/10328/Cz04g38020.t1
MHAPITHHATQGAAAQPAPEIAIVGGGITGLTCANLLAKYGYTVTVFDQGKSNPGGRTATRVTSFQSLAFDHGCQFFKADTAEFRGLVDEWIGAGVVCEWQGLIGQYNARTGRYQPRESTSASEAPANDDAAQAAAAADSGHFSCMKPGPLYVGVPSMNAICKHLAQNPQLADVRIDVKVTRAHVDDSNGKWVLEGWIRQPMVTGSDRRQQPPFTPWNLGVYDAVVLADKMTGCKGAPGYVEISGSSAGVNLQAAMAGVGSIPQMALLLAYDQQQPVLPFEAATVTGSEQIQWICNDTAKPGRQRQDSKQCYVVLATSDFSQQLIQPLPDGSLPQQTPEYLAQIAPRLYEAFEQAIKPLLGTQKPLPIPSFMQAHRWGSAFPRQPLNSSCLQAVKPRLVACGDYCLGAGIENAVLSARAAADAMRGMFES